MSKSSNNMSEFLSQVSSNINDLNEGYDSLENDIKYIKSKVVSFENLIKSLLAKQEENKGKVFDNNSIVAVNMKNPDGSYRRVHLSSPLSAHNGPAISESKKEFPPDRVIHVSEPAKPQQEPVAVKSVKFNSPVKKLRPPPLSSGVIDKPEVNVDLYNKRDSQLPMDRLVAMLREENK